MAESIDDERLAAGLDVGGTKIHGVLVAAGGRVVASVRRATPSGRAVVLAIEEAVDDLAAAAGVDVGGLASIGIGIPGRVDGRAGSVSHAVNLGLGHGAVALAEPLEQRFGLPVTVENDVNAATLGAAHVLGNGHALTDLAYVSIGTGVAAGLVLGGHLRRGVSGVAGEIGHLVVVPDGERCLCGQRGCLETVVSGAAIARRWPSDGAPAADLFRAAAAGDRQAEEVAAFVVGHLATAVMGLLLTLDVATVAIGGGVAEAGRAAHAAARQLGRRAAQAPFMASIDLPARLAVIPDAPEAAAVGAAFASRVRSRP